MDSLHRKSAPQHRLLPETSEAEACARARATGTLRPLVVMMDHVVECCMTGEFPCAVSSDQLVILGSLVQMFKFTLCT
jgi:hypothetical protein